VQLLRKGDFDHRDIHVSMDVWTADNQYLGTVRRVTGLGTTNHAHEEPPSRREGGFSGESIGPVPTQSIGNTGPVSQAAEAAYATNSDGAKNLCGGTMTVGHWAGFIKRRSIALDLVQSVSLERITLRPTKAQLDEHARR
jgi:hypothetical protein